MMSRGCIPTCRRLVALFLRGQGKCALLHFLLCMRAAGTFFPFPGPTPTPPQIRLCKPWLKGPQVCSFEQAAFGQPSAAPPSLSLPPSGPDGGQDQILFLSWRPLARWSGFPPGSGRQPSILRVVLFPFGCEGFSSCSCSCSSPSS
ncbi:hypothetical protein GGR55DRAFT_209177 [Xylaria sp. FL0064]|nr:hypothetical protein GGR55DRAFT_209177 [Xylaria sp. FL0064]